MAVTVPSSLTASNLLGTSARLGWTPVAPQKWRLTVIMTGASQDWTVDINGGVTPNIDIDWGDGGAVENFTTTGLKTHTYATAGTYVAKISGSFASGGNLRFGSGAEGTAARLKGTGAVPTFAGLTSFYSTFQSCTGLTGSIPADLFRYNTGVSSSGFRATFSGCSGLTGSIPADLFRYNTSVGSRAFRATFSGCSGLTGSIPADLFRYNTGVSSEAFYQLFYSCTGLTGSIPADLFRYNTSVSTVSFRSTFHNCIGLTGSIPADLFRYNTGVSSDGFILTFYGCSGLTNAPARLFKYNTVCSSFNGAFQICNKLQLHANIFFDTGEESTRFLNQTVDFTSAMSIGTFTGVQGTAPALWNCAFGSGTPTTTTCFTGQTSGSVTNYAAIPVAWGGPA